MPHGKELETEALHFDPDPFGDDCDPPPPSRTGRLRESYNILKDTGAWRNTDLNPESPVEVYVGHRNRIKIVEAKRDELKRRYRDICGADIDAEP